MSTQLCSLLSKCTEILQRVTTKIILSSQRFTKYLLIAFLEKWKPFYMWVGNSYTIRLGWFHKLVKWVLEKLKENKVLSFLNKCLCMYLTTIYTSAVKWVEYHYLLFMFEWAPFIYKNNNLLIFTRFFEFGENIRFFAISLKLRCNWRWLVLLIFPWNCTS